MIPSFIYGTAWKEEETERLVCQALDSGFLAIDTANQRKHYFEEAVGRGLTKFLHSHSQKRENLWLQTKFTYARGQDHRLPYDPEASFTDQVNQSFASSLKHLNTDYLDSYILHGPFSRHGIDKVDLEVWSAMTILKESGKTKEIGISNVSLPQLKELHKTARAKPAFVQNRCYARTGWDLRVREFCSENNIHYQGFSLLTANGHELNSDVVKAMAQKYNKTISQITFRFAQQMGMIPLTGTTNKAHMLEDLDIQDFELTSSEVSIFMHLS